ncbi:spermidine synthase [Streptomyces abyssalis]|uniref:Polyamine aminopropyltransferase n=1 Tax=Streptomyces abyssalis TaxID=933944 RepID=A0A1E7JPB2_9ACTN|nr:polyamine aminopropyltransferase [Streptomyces abyssalis]OEU86514.1 spermidine synthase [Streptomyces abyssalis]OEU90096.1 spermidine synthase [Streptomyces abyssalis]
MIDRPLAQSQDARLPVPVGLGRGLVLASVFVCAACGLVYELELVALASYLSGDSVTQASVVLSVMVFAMGIGSLLAKRLRCRAATGFAVVEALLALVGGGSAIALYASFAWFGGARVALVGFSLAIGVLIGAEMPLLMTLIQRIRKQDAGGALADLFAADYVGALVGGLTFPFLLLPFFGQLTGALLTGVVNVCAGGVVVLWLFRHDVSARVRWWLLAVNGAVVLLLIAATAFVASFERAARHAVYGQHVRVAVRDGQQEAVLTGDPDPTAYRSGAEPLRFYLDGRLRASSAEGNRYPAALVRPAMADGPHERVLILGGADGLVVREVLRHTRVRAVTVLERDRAAAELARTDPGLRRLNKDAYDDPRVRVETGGDPFDRLRERVRTPGAAPYDVVISDLPDPAVRDSAKLYSHEFYGLVRRVLAPDGRFAVHAGAAAAQPRTYWTVEATLRSAGLRTSPYVVRSPRDWGFVLASNGAQRTTLTALSSAGGGAGLDGLDGVAGFDGVAGSRSGADAASPLRPLTPHQLRTAGLRAERDRLTGLPPSTLTHPRH